MRVNLEKLWKLVHPDDMTEGLAAYRRYHETLRAFAAYYEFGIVPTVEAFAALSPNNDYHGNLRSLASVLNWARYPDPNSIPVVSTYQACASRALQYITGETSFLDTVKGQKIISFRHNLLYPETSREVTVDGHITAAYRAETRATMKDSIPTRSEYNSIRRDIQAMARAKDLLPSQVQAVLWITRKRVLHVKMQHPDLFLPKNDQMRAAVHPRDYPPFGTRDVATEIEG